jgi:hypothetical protein
MPMPVAASGCISARTVSVVGKVGQGAIKLSLEIMEQPALALAITLTFAPLHCIICSTEPLGLRASNFLPMPTCHLAHVSTCQPAS